MPATNCQSAARASLFLMEKKAGKEMLTAKMKGFDTSTEQADFGDPAGGATRYDLCIYGSPGLIGELSVDRAGEACGKKGKACWRATGTKGWMYKDPDASADGVRKIKAKAGAAGKGELRIQAGNKGKKGQSGMPTGMSAALEGAESARVQVVTSDAQCFEAVLGTVKKANGVQFKAKKP